MKEQPEALRLADRLDLWGDQGDLLEAAAELRRLHQHELANNVWHEKTNWVQDSVAPDELGMHRADVLKQRIDRLHEVNQELLEALKRIDQALQIPAAEYVPAISDVFKMIDAAIAKATGEQA